MGKLAVVTGEVKFEGKPTPGAILEFVPKSGETELPQMRTFAVVDKEGHFSVITAVPDGSTAGAIPGEYLISITWQKPLDPDDKDSSLGPELIPAKYTSAKTSQLEFEVQPGENVIPTINITP